MSKYVQQVDEGGVEDEMNDLSNEAMLEFSKVLAAKKTPEEEELDALEAKAKEKAKEKPKP